MSKQCLFCPNPVNSAEHIWSDWILEDLKPVQRMSDLEGENKPHMFAMMNDKPTVLTPTQQKLLTRWAILKAMVLDGSSPKRRIPFYSASERIGMKPPSRSLPVGTLTWIRPLSDNAFHAGLTDTFGQIDGIPKAFHGCVTTIVVGHLVIQVVTMHVLPMFATMTLRPDCKPGAWDVNLLEIWPVFGEKRWPPRFTFTLDGATRHIGALVNRYKMGTDITK